MLTTDLERRTDLDRRPDPSDVSELPRLPGPRDLLAEAAWITPLADLVTLKMRQAYDKTPVDHLHMLNRDVLIPVQRAMIEYALTRCGGNQVHASRCLGINRNMMRKRIAKLGIVHAPFHRNIETTKGATV